ncbi:DNA-binding transcriptional LysR family regulator [Yoonia maritima]|uniref:DNA-binding transcriptional LysR family regulator n=1 Tax=Yoonia maritima TaxID=1435347 RepID=A0A2T0W2M5_9RHOB|nr:LysR family transcriptional regulator [Yoonia maritima]PRY79474.1 DNA-binding transcriptional LysR family regulator [Yoonia maritima]
MDIRLSDLDWSLVQAFLAVAEGGSLSAAARALGASQPTLGRQIRTLETQLKADLFHRQPRGFTLTQTGAELVAPARTMRDAMQQIALTAAGQQASLAGAVRISASVAVAADHMPAIIARIRTEEPEIEIELVPTDDSQNLLYREADIAVRMYRPTQLDLVTKHLGDLELGTYAAGSYLKRRGMPRTLDEMMTHDFVGYDRSQMIIDGFRAAGINVGPEFFKTRCDHHVTYWELVRAGCGIGFAQAVVGDNDPAVERVKLGFPLPSLPIWLTAHEAMRQTPRIRRVWDMLEDGLRPLVS